MTLIKWTPKNYMHNFFDDVESMISGAFLQPDDAGNKSRPFTPFVNVNEGEKEYSISIDLPGVEKKDVEVNVGDGKLTVIAERKNNHDANSDDYIWQESVHGTLQRSFDLSNAVKEDDIKARFKNGVLNITIPKIEEMQPSVKKIAVA